MAEGMTIRVTYEGDAFREHASRFLEAGSLLDRLFRVNTDVARTLCEREGVIELRHCGAEEWTICASSVHVVGRPHGPDEG